MAAIDRLVTFDIGGVLIRLSTSFEEAANHAGVTLTGPKQLEQSEQLALHYVDWQTGRMTDQEFFEMWSSRCPRFDPRDAARLSLGWIVEEFPGMLELVKGLRANGIRMGVLSNTANHHWQYMLSRPDLFPSLRFIDHMYGSHQLGVMKPSEAIYRRFEQKTGTRSEQILFFDDLPANVEGAQRCGWKAYRIDPKADPARQVSQYLEQEGVTFRSHSQCLCPSSDGSDKPLSQDRASIDRVGHSDRT